MATKERRQLKILTHLVLLSSCMTSKQIITRKSKAISLTITLCLLGPGQAVPTSVNYNTVLHDKHVPTFLPFLTPHTFCIQLHAHESIGVNMVNQQ